MRIVAPKSIAMNSLDHYTSFKIAMSCGFNNKIKYTYHKIQSINHQTQSIKFNHNHQEQSKTQVENKHQK